MNGFGGTGTRLIDTKDSIDGVLPRPPLVVGAGTIPNFTPAAGKEEDKRLMADFKPEVYFCGQIVSGTKFSSSE